MTNGEKMQAVFPDIEMWGESKDTLDYSLGGMIHRVTKSWWNAEYQESRKGHWIDTNDYHCYNDGDIETIELRCSCCNEEVEWDLRLLHKPYYCENCGADMREVKE